MDSLPAGSGWLSRLPVLISHMTSTNKPVNLVTATLALSAKAGSSRNRRGNTRAGISQPLHPLSVYVKAL